LLIFVAAPALVTPLPHFRFSFFLICWMFPLLLLFFIYTLIKIFGCFALDISAFICMHFCTYFFNATICLNDFCTHFNGRNKLLWKNKTNINNNNCIRGWLKFIFNKKNQYFQVAFNGLCLWHLCDFDIISGASDLVRCSYSTLFSSTRTDQVEKFAWTNRKPFLKKFYFKRYFIQIYLTSITKSYVDLSSGFCEFKEK